MTLADPAPLQVDDAERRRILAQIYNLLISVADSPGDPLEPDAVLSLCLVPLMQDAEPVDLPAPLKPNSPP